MIHTWVTSNLTDGSQYVGVNGKVSSHTQVLSGVLKGSVLGPDITTLELSGGSLMLYADDILFYRAIQSDTDYKLLQRDIDKLV